MNLEEEKEHWMGYSFKEYREKYPELLKLAIQLLKSNTRLADQLRQLPKESTDVRELSSGSSKKRKKGKGRD